MEFLVHGATEFGEAGVFVAFEETAEELAKNVASLGFDLEALVRQKKLLVDHVHIERSEIQETGEFDLEGLFIRLGYAIDTIGAKRVVLDTIEALFSGLPNEMILRAELRRLFRWLKDKGVTAVITAERGEGTLTRYGPGRIRRRLCRAARPSDHRTDVDAAFARGKIPRQSSWHQRVSIPYRS
jgi:circadian clock protein KaiC